VKRPRTIIDLTHPMSSATPAFPGDPPLEITVLDSTSASTPGQRHLNCSRLAMSVHCGTHMDAPFHFFGDGVTIDRVPLDFCMGPALLARIGPEAHHGTIDLTHLTPFESRIRACPRLVLDLGWHHRFGREGYFSEHPVISGPAAQRLVDLGVKLLGVDTPSVDRSPFPAHLALLGAGVLIVENLTNLAAIPGDHFELFAVPLPISARDGSPVRALALVEE
jgi:kynurenine formamidase